MARSRMSFPSWLRPPTAVLAALWVLTMGALAVRPDWHEVVCHHHEHDASPEPADAHGDEADGCIITHFAHGQIFALFATLPVLDRVPSAIAEVAAWEAEAVTRDLSLPPGCGPPVA